MPRPQRKAPPYDPEAVIRLLRQQAGVVRRDQLAALGVTDADVARQVRRRILRRLSRSVYCEGTGVLSPVQVAWWACLHFDRGAAADLTALQIARDASGSKLILPVQIAVPRGRGGAALPGVVLHRVARIDTVVARVGLPRMRPEHAALRVAAGASGENAVVGALADAVNWRVTTPRRMREALVDLPRLPQRALIREVLDDLSAGACSVLERGYLVKVERAHGLPEGERQEPRKSAGGWEFRDVVYVLYRLVVELDGRTFHSGKKARDKDMQRDLDDLVERRDAARLGYAQVFDTPCRTAAKVGVLLQQRGWGGSPVRCGDSCAIDP